TSTLRTRPASCRADCIALAVPSHPPPGAAGAISRRLFGGCASADPASASAATSVTSRLNQLMPYLPFGLRSEYRRSRRLRLIRTAARAALLVESSLC